MSVGLHVIKSKSNRQPAESALVRFQPVALIAERYALNWGKISLRIHLHWVKILYA